MSETEPHIPEKNPSHPRLKAAILQITERLGNDNQLTDLQRIHLAKIKWRLEGELAGESTVPFFDVEKVREEDILLGRGGGEYKVQKLYVLPGEMEERRGILRFEILREEDDDERGKTSEGEMSLDDLRRYVKNKAIVDVITPEDVDWWENEEKDKYLPKQ